GPTGCWTSTGFFRDIWPQPDGTFVLTFADRTTWTFASFDGSPSQGRIVSVRDSDANQTSFLYDPAGRLATITDTLERPITIHCTGDGYIASATDFGGRQVVYAYYTATDVDGMPGALKSVRSPAVTNTPNGNDFPDGKTTVYTYTRNTGQP